MQAGSDPTGATTVTPAPRGRNPFDDGGVQRGADGRAFYADRPDSLVHLLRASVQRDGSATAIVEVGGRSLTYRELWDGAARVAGGLGAMGVQRGDRVAIRLGNGADWVLAFFGCQLLGAVVVPVNTRFTEHEVAYVIEDSGAKFSFSEPESRCPTASRRPSTTSRPTTSRRSSTRAARPAFPRAR